MWACSYRKGMNGLLTILRRLQKRCRINAFNQIQLHNQVEVYLNQLGLLSMPFFVLSVRFGELKRGIA